MAATKSKKVIYTVITGGYDNLIEQPQIKGYDYVCFTDNTELKSDIWTFRKIPEELKGLSFVKQQRAIKILTHKYLPEYDFSVYIDGNVQVVGDVNTYIKENCPKTKGYIFIGKHPDRDCIFDEAKACIYARKDDAHKIADQVIEYHKEGMPLHYGLTQTCIIFRYHNNENCKRLMELWWDEVREKSHRDQLSLYYCLWKDRQGGNNTDIVVLDKAIFHGDVFKWNVTHSDVKKPTLLAKSNDNIFWMRFPKPEQTIWSLSDWDSFLKDKKTIDMRWLNLKYMVGYKCNEHHLYPSNFYKMILPLMNLYIKNLNFNMNDFELVDYFSEDKRHDLSYLVPKNKDMKFTFSKEGKVLSEHGDFSSLNFVNEVWDDTTGYEINSNYHKLFRGSHSCCKIINETIDNDKKLLVTGDSMLIPAIPILCCYYKEVVFLDNRNSKSNKQYFENVVFDDVIIEIYEAHGKLTISKPLVINLQ